MAPKRQRTVQGSCWPCKQRRVKCDLARPQCQRCVLSGAKCSYGKILVRWSSRPTKGTPVTYQSSNVGPSSPPKDNLLATGELRALEYFQVVLWPLFTTVTHPCLPPISLAMECQPVLLAMCELAESHRAVKDSPPDAKGNLQCNDKRSSCLASVREQLCQGVSNNASLSRLLVAVLLLYFLDGFIECTSQSASTASHQAGVRAIVDRLGGFTALIDMGQKDTNMLLSEFASTDLTRSLLDGRCPYFPADIWLRIESGTVWWEKKTYNGTNLALVFRTMSQMSFYRQSLNGVDDCQPLSMEIVQDFERRLQPTFLTLDLDHLSSLNTSTMGESSFKEEEQAVAFTRVFQHSALIYLYRAICGLPARHCLFQQHVQSCVECIKSINSSSKSHNCIVFPLYVMGAHAFTADNQAFVLERLDTIYECLRFDSVLSIRAVLKDLWASPRHDGNWSDMFTALSQDVLVL